jgi:predicted MFS family arabinose efflux permease
VSTASAPADPASQNGHGSDPATPPEFVPPVPAAPRGLARLGSALASRNFRLLWIANVVSTSGTWMQNVAQRWLVYTLTGSALLLGADDLLAGLPILLLTLVGGVMADRYNRRYLLMASQALQLTCALILMTLVYFHVIQIWHILALSFAAGVGQAFGGPAFQSLIPSLVPRRDLPNAVALNSIQFNLSRIMGPVIAGATVASLGMAACFGLNGVSFLFVIGALLLMNVPPQTPGPRRSLMQEMMSGLRYVRNQPALTMLMALAFFSAFLAFPLQTLLPVFARDVFGQSVGGYARMLGFSGAGAVVGALFVAWQGKSARMAQNALIVQGLLGAGMVAFAYSRWAPLSYALLFFTGGTTMVLASTMMSLIQLIAPDDMRGRVMSIYNVAFRGGLPLGAPVAGLVASQISAPRAIAINGVLLICASAWFMTRGGVIRDLQGRD